MILSDDLIIKSLILVFQLCVWLSKGLIIKTKSSIVKLINTPQKSLTGILENNRPSEVHNDMTLTRVIVVSPTPHLLVIHQSFYISTVHHGNTDILSFQRISVCECVCTHEGQPCFAIFKFRPWKRYPRVYVFILMGIKNMDPLFDIVSLLFMWSRKEKENSIWQGGFLFLVSPTRISSFSITALFPESMP